MNQTAGVISVIKEFGVGTRDDNKIGTGTYNLSGGSITVANNIFIGKELGSSGTLNITGGTLWTSDKLQIGHNQATGILTQSGGTVNVQNEVYIGNENSASSVGAYTLSGTGVLNVGNEVIVGRDNGTGTFNLNGGTLSTLPPTPLWLSSPQYHCPDHTESSLGLLREPRLLVLPVWVQISRPHSIGRPAP
ncbi:MAG: hypothetical protein EBW82_00550 [Verrucomicrobia bacterium]|nr:hypothetical protein [Verrucomicrobiota bacterium]